MLYPGPDLGLWGPQGPYKVEKLNAKGIYFVGASY